MKTIALLWMGALLALAVDKNKDKQAPDPKIAPKTANSAPMASRSAHAPAAGVQPARRNLHRTAVAPVAAKLTPEQKASAALPTVPPGSEEVGPNLFRYTDPQGKRWMYRQTPFGVSKWEDKPEQHPAPQAPSPAGITATDLGDSVQFQRLTPFGPQKWTRKKTELTDDEKASLAAKPADGAKSPEKQPEKQ